MTTIFFYVLLFQIKDWDKICEEEGKMTSPIICYILLYFARGYLIHNLDAYTFHIAVFAIEAEGKETYFPETR